MKVIVFSLHKLIKIMYDISPWFNIFFYKFIQPRDLRRAGRCIVIKDRIIYNTRNPWKILDFLYQLFIYSCLIFFLPLV